MALIPFIRQKITTPPAGSTILPRTRLYDMLSQGNEKLVAVVAPAGYGKSVFLTNWVQTTNAQACWYSLDPGDNHRVNFIHYLIESIRVQFPAFGGSLIRQLHTSQPQIEQILVQMIRELFELKEQLYLIIDDFHFITNPDVHRILHYLLVYLPQNITVIISSRTPLPIPLAKMRIHNQLLEIDMKDLALNCEETARLLQIYQLRPDEKQAREIFKKTEGWPAGIQLIALSRRQARDKSRRTAQLSKQDVHDYLFEEVFEGLPADMQQFLLTTSILEQLQESLCNNVTERSDSHIFFERLMRDNLFLIPLDDERPLYRYHHLFSDFLQNRLRRTDPEIVKALHSRAARWYEAKCRYTEALNHELAADNPMRACTLLVKMAPTMLNQGNAEEFINMIDHIPFAYVTSSPFLLIYYCWALSLCNRTDEATDHILFLENQVDSGAYSPENRHALLLEIWHFHGHISFLRKNFDDILKYRLKISDYLPYESDILKSIDFNPNHMHLSRGFLGSHGDFASSSAFFNKITEYIEQGFPLEDTIWGLLAGYLGELNLERNELDKAESYLAKAMQIGRKEKLAGVYIPSFVTFIHLKKLQHPAYPTEDAIGDLKQFIIDSDMRQWQLALDAFKIRMDMRDGQHSRLGDWLERTKLLTDRTLTLEREYEYLTLLRVWIALDRGADAIALIDRLYIVAESEQKYGAMIELLLLKSMAFDRENESAEAKSQLLKALRLGMKMGWFMTFVFEGAALLPLFEEVMAEENNESRKTYINHIVMSMKKHYPASIDKGNRRFDDLTDREFEILTLISQGLRNKEIAAQLNLTVGTVKGYCNRIFDKLQVDNRTQATLLFNQDSARKR